MLRISQPAQMSLRDVEEWRDKWLDKNGIRLARQQSYDNSTQNSIATGIFAAQGKSHYSQVAGIRYVIPRRVE